MDKRHRRLRARYLLLAPALIAVGYLLHPVGANAQLGPEIVIRDRTVPANKAMVDGTGALKVAGNLTLSGMPTVNAVQSGAWNVGITGTSSIELAPEPYSRTREDSFGFADVARVGFEVPANKVLVIEFISVDVEVPTGQ